MLPMTMGGSERRRWPRRWPRSVFAAWTLAGCSTGFLLGVLGSFILSVITFISAGLTSYTAYEACLIFAIGIFTGSFTGLIVGIADGLVIGLLSRLEVFHSRTPIRRIWIPVAAAVTTGLSGFAVLDHLFSREPLLFYLPVIVGALLAVALSRKLPPIRKDSASLS